MAGTATKLHVHDCGSLSCGFNGAHLRSDYEGLEFEKL
jgi:hypothetical protein